MRGLVFTIALVAALAAFAQDGGTPLAPGQWTPEPASRSFFGCDKRAQPDAESWKLFSLFNESNDQPEPPPFYFFEEDERNARVVVDDDRLDYLNGLGALGRCWELTSDTAYGARQALTQRVEIARAFKAPTKSLSLVLRVGFGADAQLATGVSAVQGVTASLGLRHQPAKGGFSIEAGVRLIPGWGGPQDSVPEIQELALDATYTSGIGNDAAWLPFSSTGVQLYTQIQSRTGIWVLPGWTMLLGARYGGAVSIGTMQVRTWLGPQSAFIGNVFVEGFVGIPTIRSVAVRLQLGAHVDASLSSIWPGATTFPGVANGFLAWSPATWLVLRFFAGAGGAPGSHQPARLQYGGRLQFYLP